VPASPKRLLAKTREKYHRRSLACQMVDVEIQTLSEYLDVLSGIVGVGGEFWFRGHGCMEWKLVPSALRYTSETLRTRAVNMITEFKRFAEIKIDRAPAQDDGF
jgi:hypothetical protein